MKFGLQNYKTALVMLVAIASFLVCLAFTAVRLFEVERDLRTDAMYSNIWFVTQAQFEAAIFSESLARLAANETFSAPEQAPDFRANILISRLAVLLEGRHGRIMEEIGVSGDIRQAYLQLTMAEPILRNGIDAPAAVLLGEQIRELAYKLRDAANQVVWLNRDQSVTKRAKFLQIAF
jgi:hypothetical protein